RLNAHRFDRLPYFEQSELDKVITTPRGAELLPCAIFQLTDYWNFVELRTLDNFVIDRRPEGVKPKACILKEDISKQFAFAGKFVVGDVVQCHTHATTYIDADTIRDNSVLSSKYTA